MPPALRARDERRRRIPVSGDFCLAVYLVAILYPLIGSSKAEEPPERLLPPLVITGNTNEGLYIYGQVNKGVLLYDDGNRQDVYPIVDNSNSSTRFGIWLHDTISPAFRFSANFEFEWNPYATGNVNQDNKDDVDWSTKKLRKAEGVLDLGNYGRVWLGQGGMASDGTAEADLSGTTVAAYSAVSDTAGGQLFARSDGSGLSDVSVGGAFGNLDGLGRKTRLRFDTPTIDGLRLGASFGSDQVDGPDDMVWDVAATYSDEIGDMGVRAGAAYSEPPDDRRRLSGSFSMIHKPSGLNFTVAGGYEDRSGRNPEYLYGKLGWRPRLTSVGATSFAVDVYSGTDFSVSDSESSSVGLAAVQMLDYYQTDLFATARWYDFDDPAASYKPSIAVLTGARFRF